MRNYSLHMCSRCYSLSCSSHSNEPLTHSLHMHRQSKFVTLVFLVVVSLSALVHALVFLSAAFWMDEEHARSEGSEITNLEVDAAHTPAYYMYVYAHQHIECSSHQNIICILYCNQNVCMCLSTIIYAVICCDMTDCNQKACV